MRPTGKAIYPKKHCPSMTYDSGKLSHLPPPAHTFIEHPHRHVPDGFLPLFGELRIVDGGCCKMEDLINLRGGGEGVGGGCVSVSSLSTPPAPSPSPLSFGPSPQYNAPGPNQALYAGEQHPPTRWPAGGSRFLLFVIPLLWGVVQEDNSPQITDSFISPQLCCTI